MQFHENGFQSGDPAISDPRRRVMAPPLKQPLPEQADVLVVGCGPAGLMLAAYLSQISDLSVCIVDQKDDRLLVGQADGIACRTMELFQSFGFAEEVEREAYGVNEAVFWRPGEQGIERRGRIQDVEDDLSEFPHVIINQARVHDHFLRVMEQGVNPILPFYGRKMLDLVRDDSEEYPVEVRFEKMPNFLPQAQVETIRAKYVVGCDGARSRVRSAIGHELHGDALNQAWGVMDVLANTDFPDVRLKAAIQSKDQGNMLIIPREGGYMFRVYIELDKLAENERIDREVMTIDRLIEAANRILSPYTLNVKEVAWWSVYEIGQRLTTAFDDSEKESDPRVLLAGDACHTHSPKAGQGLNTSVNDTWNLAWKLAHVLKGYAPKSLIRSYSEERQKIAKILIDFDREWAAMFSAKPKSEENPDGVDPAAFQAYFQKFSHFTAGVGIQYEQGPWIGSDTHQALAKGLLVGKRFHTSMVTRMADAKPVQLGHVHKADGAWRVYVFASDALPMSDECHVKSLCEYFDQHPDSAVLRSREGLESDALVDLRVVFQQPHDQFEWPSLHPRLRPSKGKFGLRDYEKVFCSHVRWGQDIYQMRGIDRSGCIVIVRPDQYVSDILPLNDFQGLEVRFGQALLEVPSDK